MKKGLIIGFCFLFILIALVSVVSAGFFSDIWGKITGKAVWGTDADGDGYFAEINDCDDTNPDVNPGKSERCSNGIDDNCDGDTDCDDGSCMFSITCLSCVSCIYDGYGWCHSADFSGCTIESKYCSGTYMENTNVCDGLQGPTCADDLQNGAETGVDCGGPCNACPTCFDGIQNQLETGVDCGGPCATCLTCDDGIQNQLETGIDCGGPCATCPTCGDGTLDSGEECDDGNIVDADACTNACEDNICGDGFLNTTGEECDDGNIVDGDGCSSTCIVQACVDGRQDYALPGSDLSVNSKCDVEFKSEVITSSLSTLGKTFTLENKEVIKILNITVNETVSSATLSFTLDEDDFRFPVDQLLIYIENNTAPSDWSLLPGTFSKKSGGLWEYTALNTHFSLFLIVEPNFCGNEIFESDYYEECDDSTHCTNCECDLGYEGDGSGNCVEKITGKECSGIGDENCTGYTLYECGVDFKWNNKGIVVSKCGVECLSGDKSCDGEISLLCGSNYQLRIQGEINGLCGVLEEEEKGERKIKPLTIFLIIGAVLLCFLVLLLLLRRFKEETSTIFSQSTQTTT